MKKLIAIVAVPLMIFAGSCKKYLECEDCKTNPNSPANTTAAQYLTASQVATFSTFEGQLARYAGIFTQQLAGVQFQFVAFARYNINDNDLENEWNQLYSDCLINLKELIEKFGDGNPWYRGIAKVLLAMNLGITTDSWGDIPFSQALQGTDNLNPTYDSQEAIYAAIQTMLNEAIVDLSADAEENEIFPTDKDDLIFKGKKEKWISVAWVLKARYANHLSKRNPVGSANDAINYLQQAAQAGFSDDPDNDAVTKHGIAGNELNQWYSFNVTRGGYIKISETFMNLLQTTNDPRLGAFAEPDNNGGYSGTPLGSTDDATSNIGSYYSSPAASVPLVSYVEAKFIEAEAKLRANDAAGAAAAHNDAVKASVLRVTGASDPVFEAAQANENAGSITLEKIMTQKYVALFLQNEVWVDWRRTGFPALTPDPRAVTPNKQIPRRLITPQVENVTNTNSPKITNSELPVWWDE